MPIKRPWRERYWEKVDVCEPNECWPWIGAKVGGGYGSFKLRQKMVYAHRLAWILANGRIPNGLCVLHHCDNRSCCNPVHLWLGTYSDNARDMMRKGRGGRGAQNGNSKLTRADVRAIRSLYAAGKYTQREIGDQFGVANNTVSLIVNYKRWMWLGNGGDAVIEKELAQRFVGYATLEGDDAAAVMAELTTFGGWRMWVQAALASLTAGDPCEAARLLEQLLREYDNGA